MSGAPIRAQQITPLPGIAPVTADEIAAATTRMRALPQIDSASAAKALASVLDAWRDHNFAPRRAIVNAIAAASGYSESLLEASLDALLLPFTSDALADFAALVTVAGEGDDNRRGRIRADWRWPILGMVMPGNLPGAGLHEVVIGLLSGAKLILKTSISEPLFFANFARSIGQFDRALAQRIAVFNWGRDRDDLAAAMRSNCDWLAAFGDDETLRALAEAANGRHEAREGEEANKSEAQLSAGFGERYSGAYISVEHASVEHANDTRARQAVAEALARDVTLFEQAGCLSPHHIFVQDDLSGRGSGGRAYRFAGDLASALEALSGKLPPPTRIGLETAANLRRVREVARWRMLGGESIALWEGPNLDWTVIYDEEADFTPSPRFRTITVSPVKDLSDLAQRLASVAGKLEAFAVAGPADGLTGAAQCLSRLGVSYLCAPGEMQSPPLQWRHGGGAFLDAILQP